MAKEDAKASAVIEGYGKEKSRRATWEAHWDEIARLVSPKDDVFYTKHTPGDKRTGEVFDTTAIIGLSRYASFMDSILTPRNQKWHGLAPSNPELKKVHEVSVWFDQLTELVFKNRYRPQANFASQNYEVLRSEGAFGTGGLIINDSLDGGSKYKSIHLSELFCVENAEGLIDTVYRFLPLTAKKAKEMFDESRLPEKIREGKGSDPADTFDFIHYIAPNPDYDPESLAPDKKRYISCYVAVEERLVVREGGFNTFPIAIARAETSPLEVYGRSPAMMVLPAIKMLNQMKKTDIRMVHRTVDPTILMKDDGSVRSIDMRPGKHIIGGLDRNGQPTIMPFNAGARVDINEAKMEIERAEINRAFLVDLFLMQVEREMTATEVLHRSKEQSLLLSSTTGRLESEYLSKIIEREIDILQTSGQLPPMPPELEEAGGEWEVEYTNPMSRAQRAEEAIGAEQIVRAAFEAANFMPEVLDNINGDEYLRIIREAGGAPSVILNSPESVQEVRQARAQEQQEQQELEKAKMASEGGLNAAKANQVTSTIKE